MVSNLDSVNMQKVDELLQIISQNYPIPPSFIHIARGYIMSDPTKAARVLQLIKEALR